MTKRVVIDCGHDFKKRAYEALDKAKLTMKAWFMREMSKFIEGNRP